MSTITTDEKTRIDTLFVELTSFFNSLFKGSVSITLINNTHSLIYSCFEDISYTADYGLEKLEVVLETFLNAEFAVLEKTKQELIPTLLQKQFDEWKNVRKYLLFVFSCLDYCPHQRVNATVKSVLKHTFRETFFEKLVVNVKIFDVLVSLISTARFSAQLKTNDLHAILSILQFHFDEQLAFHLQSFQRKNEEQALTDYRAFLATLDKLNVSELLNQLIKFVDNERSMINQALLPNMQLPMTNLLHMEIIDQISPKVVSSYRELLEGNKEKEILVISKLFDGPKEATPFVEITREFFKRLFDDKEKESEKTTGSVEGAMNYLIAMKEKAEHMKRTYFYGNVYLVECVSNTMKNCLSRSSFKEKGEEKTVEAIMGSYSQKVLTTASEEMALSKMGEVIDLAMYLPSKENFIAIYQKLLIKRIVEGTSKSMGVETKVVDEISKNFGNALSQRLKKILSDTTLSLEMTQQFKEKEHPSVKMGVTVFSKFLVTNSESYEDVILSDEIKRVWEKFVSWYCARHQERRLEMDKLNSSVVLSYEVSGKKKKVTVSYIQYLMIHLMSLKEGKGSEYTVVELQKAISDKLECFMPHLRTLVKSGLVAINSDQRVCLTGNESIDDFLLDKIERKNKKKEHKEEKTEEEEEKVFTSVICFLTKLMKQKKDMKYDDLTKESVTTFGNGFEVKTMKKGIEYLIEKEYILRDDQDANLFHYIA
ncbi:cullin-4B, putative [Entamoeba invadens IP1]|uniref:Cullin-4B, putative n=1 Tax=Entamoeba invadens IP1 TaxID=370355 RepID=A0A0A1TZ89_ENTIV|nr:cullin-4B, putative [Entamoeba invadens IP1]ELP83831.1 cullin-4B, putative [Entamoeba invadens IP1]|eukprot:XP_004183177.1 cullin-4B, putative [Entamoeba invadens IP1]